MRLPIIEIPRHIQEVCQNYKDNFSVSQFKNFENFITGIIINDKADIQALSQGFELGRHYDSLHHFICESHWDMEEVFKTSVSVIKHLSDKSRRFSRKGWLIIDDSLIEKFGKFMQAISKFYDHCESRYLEYAHCLVALIYTDINNNRYPLKFDLYVSKEYCQRTKQGFRTKIEIAKELIQYALDQGVPFQGVIFDSWYFSKDFVDFIESIGRDWISQSRTNREIIYQGRRIKLGEYIKAIDTNEKRKLSKTTVGEKAYRYKLLKVSMPSLKRGRETVRVIISYEYDKNNRLKEPIFLVSNRKDCRVERVLMTYQMRWAIETYFKDAKQHLGLKDYQMRGLKGIKSHWCLVFTSAVILELMRADCISETGSNRSHLSVGELCQRAFNQAFKSVIKWTIEQTNNSMPEKEIFSCLGIKT